MTPDDAPLTPTDVAALLAATAAALRAELSALPPVMHGWRPGRDEWCVKEILGHLIEAERRGFAGRIRTILDEDAPRLQSWDQEAVARERRDAERTGDELLGEFAALRTASIALVRGLGAADLRRLGHHPTIGEVTIGDLLNEWVYHDRDHFRQVLANVQAAVWSTMGNTRQFYEP